MSTKTLRVLEAGTSCGQRRSAASGPDPPRLPAAPALGLNDLEGQSLS